MGEEPLLLQRSCGQAGVQRRQRHAGTSPRLGHRTVGYAAFLGPGELRLGRGLCTQAGEGLPGVPTAGSELKILRYRA